MKISASIYANKQAELKDTIINLQNHGIELLHVDCNDDPKVFEDIKYIRSFCNIPIDLHLITSKPQEYWDLILEHKVDYVTFQYENLPKDFQWHPDLKAKRGIAITTDTDVKVFEAYKDWDFSLIMCTTPGQSGGSFKSANFQKINWLRANYPGKNVHVDGGVNAEVSFILRNMGVYAAVSGSYLFKEVSVGNALMNLTKRSHNSEYSIKEFMLPVNEKMILNETELSIQKVLIAIEQGKHGFSVVLNQDDTIKGIISNADIRRGLIANEADTTNLNPTEIINQNMITVNEDQTVKDLLKIVKAQSFPILYLPVLNSSRKVTGIVTFVNLIKGEL